MDSCSTACEWAAAGAGGEVKSMLLLRLDDCAKSRRRAAAADWGMGELVGREQKHSICGATPMTQYEPLN